MAIPGNSLEGNGGAKKGAESIDVGSKAQHNLAFASWMSAGMAYFSPMCKNAATKEMDIR